MNNKGFLDIHMHVIPFVDDGADDLDDAINMLKIASSEGIKNIIATPHSGALKGTGGNLKKNFNIRKNPKNKESSCNTTIKACALEGTRGGVLKYFNMLKEIARNENIQVELGLGCEIRMDYDNISKIIKKVKKGIYPTLNGTNKVLVEFFSNDEFCSVRDSMSALLNNDYQPVIAHAEKYNLSTEEIGNLRDMGCLIQINYSDINPKYSNVISKKANALLEKQMADFIATDAHHSYRRTPHIKGTLEYLYKNYDSEYIDRLIRGYYFN